MAQALDHNFPTPREEELLQHTVHPDEFKEFTAEMRKRIQTLEIRFNELCRMLSVHFNLLEIPTDE
jgi:hypothetical protein